VPAAQHSGHRSSGDIGAFQKVNLQGWYALFAGGKAQMKDRERSGIIGSPYCSRLFCIGGYRGFLLRRREIETLVRRSAGKGKN
jgi:hypothetical protein